MLRIRRFLTRALAVAIILSLGGCGSGAVVYVETSEDYSADSADALYEQVSASKLTGRSVAEVEPLRHSALVDLRSQGLAGAAAADLITETFPVQTRAVPIYVERATFEGTPAIILVELTGRADGTLEDLRLWAVDDAGDILYSSTRPGRR